MGADEDRSRGRVFRGWIEPKETLATCSGVHRISSGQRLIVPGYSISGEQGLHSVQVMTMDGFFTSLIWQFLRIKRIVVPL